MKLFRILFIGLFVLSFNSADIHAAEDKILSTDVSAFINSSENLKPLAEEMRQKSIPHFFEVQVLSMTAKNAPSHLKAMENLKENHPEYYKRTSDIITAFKQNEEYVYKSPEQWAKMADRIILTFYTTRSDGNDRNFKEMSERAAPLIQMSKMNPEMGKKMQGVLDMLQSFSEVTVEDQNVVRQYSEPLALHFAAYPQK